MKVFEVNGLTPDQKANICALWNREYPSGISVTAEGFEEYLGKHQAQRHFIFPDDEGNVIGWAFTFDRDEDRWFAIIVDRRHHGKGIGSELLSILKQRESRLNGWVIDQDDYFRNDGTPYRSPLLFYQKNDFHVSTGPRFESNGISAVQIQWWKK